VVVDHPPWHLTETDVDYQHYAYSVLITSSYEQGQRLCVTISSRPVPGSVKWSWVGAPTGHGKCAHGTGWQTWRPVIDEVTWLRPTRPNLALLTVHPPAGLPTSRTRRWCNTWDRFPDR
jgi:hypothetical protein